MNLGICTLASSSSGNCYIIKSDTTVLVLDIGVTAKKLNADLAVMGLSPKDIDGILITHEHIDHIKGLKTLMKQTDCSVFMSEGTQAAYIKKNSTIPYQRLSTIVAGNRYIIGDIEVTPFNVSHDTAEPVAFSFRRNGTKISVVTDTGYISEEIFENIKDSDILVIEANHERNILLYGRYPYSLKYRILSDEGHLSNEACADAIVRILKENDSCPTILLAHLSRENNTPAQAMITVRNAIEENGFYIGSDLELSVIEPDTMSEIKVI